MRRIPFRIVAFCLIFLILSCGRTPTEGESASLPITIKVALPTSLSGYPARWEHFKQRADSLFLTLDTARGEHFANSFALSQMDSIPLPPLPFPKDEQDALTVHAEIWVKSSEGFRRGSPVLVGKAELKAKSLSSNPIEVSIPMKLTVSVREFN